MSFFLALRLFSPSSFFSSCARQAYRHLLKASTGLWTEAMPELDASWIGNATGRLPRYLQGYGRLSEDVVGVTVVIMLLSTTLSGLSPCRGMAVWS